MALQQPPAPSNGVHPKVAASAVGAAVAGIVVWALNTYAHANIPSDVQGEIEVVFVTVFGYLMPAA